MLNSSGTFDDTRFVLLSAFSLIFSYGNPMTALDSRNVSTRGLVLRTIRMIGHAAIFWEIGCVLWADCG